jgi:hypothetical protein
MQNMDQFLILIWNMAGSACFFFSKIRKDVSIGVKHASVLF